MKKVLAPCVLALAAAAIFFAPSASAAVEFGNSCVGTTTAPGAYTLVTLQSDDATLPIAAPSAGVVTKMTFTYKDDLPFAIPGLALVLRPTGEDSAFKAIGAQQFRMNGKVTAFDTRIPVAPGDRLGLTGEPFNYMGSEGLELAFYCQRPGTILGAIPTRLGVGEAAAFPAAAEAAVPLVARLEPDADGDGYGDETQDKCPQGAATQDVCPLVVLDALTQLNRSSVTVVIAVSVPAPVTVTARVGLGKGKSVRFSAPMATVKPGSFGRFKLNFPKSLRKRLKELPPSRKLTMKITATATNIAGATSSDALSAKLKGQQKPRPRGS